jgi:peroxiredoxin (alkyl hydroperoxide reductase subunit C)
MIKVGDKIPSVGLATMSADGPKPVTTDEFFKGKKVVVFGLPGAFTPTCSAKHLPGFVRNADALKKKGIDAVACISVNDAFVMGAWGKDLGVGDKVAMLADGSADFAKATGLTLDLTARGMGVRSTRYSMVVEDGVVKKLDIESNPGACDVSSAEHILADI